MKVYPIGFSQNPLLLRKMMPIFEVHHVILIWFAIYAVISFFKMFFFSNVLYLIKLRSNPTSCRIKLVQRRDVARVLIWCYCGAMGLLGIMLFQKSSHERCGLFLIRWQRPYANEWERACTAWPGKPSYSRSQMICDWLCDGLPADACERMCVLSVWFSRALMSI